MRRSKVLAVLLLAAVLSACASGPRVETKGGESVNIYPDNYKAEVLAFLRNYLNDLSGIRDASISVPAVRPVGNLERYVVCVHFSARTPGASASGRDYLAIFLAGKLDQMGAAQEHCKEAAYQPFPELERIKR
jgi:sulfite reductase alpha subunit-like flavoprotein